LDGGLTDVKLKINVANDGKIQDLDLIVALLHSHDPNP
jgi:hypothetical protein